jgi:DegV family protein with EDD domain
MRIVMDDAGDVPAELAERYRIVTVPVNITFGTEEYLSGIELDAAGFHEKAKEVDERNFPKSSQPTPFQFAETYRALLAEGEDEIMTITVGEKLSGTYASAKAAAAELKDQGTFHLFDSAGGSASQGYMVLEAARMAQDGAPVSEILTRLEWMRQEQVVVFMIDSLEYAVKGGRVGSLQSSLASLLRIKPIMELKDGLIAEAGRVRTYNKALEYIVNKVAEDVGEQPVKMALIHAHDPEGVVRLRQQARQRLNISEEFESEMAVSVAINLGPGALGIVAIPEQL